MTRFQLGLPWFLTGGKGVREGRIPTAVLGDLFAEGGAQEYFGCMCRIQVCSLWMRAGLGMITIGEGLGTGGGGLRSRQRIPEAIIVAYPRSLNPCSRVIHKGLS